MRILIRIIILLHEETNMQPLTSASAQADSAKVNLAKKAVNLSMNKDLLARARHLNINLSATLEQALIEKLKKQKREQWIIKNRKSIQACNELAEQNGLFADTLRE